MEPSLRGARDARDAALDLKHWRKLPSPTRRQLQILTLAYNDKRSQQIADDLCLSKRTVDFHLSTLYRKWNVRSCYEASKIAIALGLLKGRQYEPMPRPERLPPKSPQLVTQLQTKPLSTRDRLKLLKIAQKG